MIRAGFTEQAIDSYDAARLAHILRYHIMIGRLSSSTLVGNLHHGRPFAGTWPPA